MASGDMSDYMAYVGPESGAQVNLAELQRLAELQAEREAAVARAEEALEAAKKNLREVSEVLLPQAMDAAGIPEFRTTSGLLIKVKETIRAAIPKAREREAFEWLRANKHEKMIKRLFSIAFSSGEEERANEVLDILARQQVDVEDKSSVHPATLSSFVREKLEKGEPVPLDLFGVFRQRAALIEVPKAK